MSGYIEFKIRADKNPSGKYISDLLKAISVSLKENGLSGVVKCTNTKEEVNFKYVERPPINIGKVKDNKKQNSASNTTQKEN